jgi:CubicO group peptidase (beta-lactamase class C family)
VTAMKKIGRRVAAGTLALALLPSGLLLAPPVLRAVQATTTPAAPAPAPRAAEGRDAAITAKLEEFRAAAKIPALGATLVTTDGAVGEWVTGVRANGHPEKVERDDVWHLGSCTKSMTATLIALLVESGKLDWETPLEKLLPECAATMDPQYKDVTLELLLKHRAGVPNDASRDGLWASFRDKSRDKTPTEQRARMAKTILSWPPVHAPRTNYLYSNFGVSIAGHVAEVATGKPYEQLMRELLFDPLGMKSAGFGAPGRKSADGPRRESGGSPIDTPRGHTADGTEIEPGEFADNPPAIGPGGRAYASLADWAKYVAVQLRGAKGDVKIGAITLHRATFEKLQSPFDGPGEKYAAGWFVCQRPWAGGDGMTLMHNGSNTLWYCVAWLGLDAGVAVLATTNQYTPKSQAAADQACSLLIGEQKALRAKAAEQGGGAGPGGR